MIFEFTSPLYLEGNRAWISVPFNMWEAGFKGNIPARVRVGQAEFECKLMPKGEGNYLIPVTKAVLSKLAPGEEYPVCMEPIAALTRINRDSPYSTDHPVRHIDSISPIEIKSGLCSHCVAAMLAGVSLDEVTALMGKGHASWSKLIETLDYYGIAHGRAVYCRGKSVPLPKCCIVNNDGGMLLWYDGAWPGADAVDEEKTVGYIEIFTD